MKSRILQTGLSFLLVVALVLVAGLAFAGGEKEKPDVATTAPGEPQYGGTINYLSIGSIWGEPTNPDIGAGFMGTSFQYLFPMLERPFILGGILIVLGYLKGWVTRADRYDYAGFRESLHAWQLHRLKLGKRLETLPPPPD